jgi:fibronectin-binding autotransporter adhesin
MRPFITRLLTLLSFIVASLAVNAQTYNIPASVSTSSFGSLSSCSGCTINLSPGVVLTVNSNVSCSNCTFNGGTINFTSGSVTMNGTNAFNNDTVLINEALNVNSMNFSGDSVAINSNLIIGSGGTTISNSAIAVNSFTSFISVTMTSDRIHSKAAITSNGTTLTNTALTLSGNGSLSVTSGTVTGSTIVMNGTSTNFVSGGSMTVSTSDITMNSSSTMTSAGAMSITGGSITSAGKISTGSSVTIAGDTLTMTGGYLAASSITVKANGTTGSILTMSGSAHDSTGGNLTMTNTALTMSNTSYMKSSSSTFTSSAVTLSNTAILEPTNGLTFTSSTVQMNDTTAITAGSLTIQTGSYVTIGNNGTSTASITIQNGLKVLDTSTLAISGHNNYLTSGNNSFTGGSTSYPINNNTVSCGGAGENACKPDFVFGCATMNAGGAVGCTVLAVADIELSASPAGDNEVNLSWSDLQYASADHYLVQRSAAGGDWKTLATIDGNGYAAGSYHFEDAAAPAGTDNYRIARLDQSGATVYSTISSVTLVSAIAAIRIYPNPAAGHTFNISAPSTGQFILNIYTLTGQLLMHTTLQGQNQYPVQLPSQLVPGTTVVVQTILADRSSSFPLLLR